MEDCSICLQKLNGNCIKFCCSVYHRECILQAVNITGKCPICRYSFKLYQSLITEQTYNLDQVKYKIIENLKEENEILKANLHNVIMDFGTRLSAMEMYQGNGNNSMINNHSIRIDMLERELNNIS